MLVVDWVVVDAVEVVAVAAVVEDAVVVDEVVVVDEEVLLVLVSSLSPQPEAEIAIAARPAIRAERSAFLAEVNGRGSTVAVGGFLAEAAVRAVAEVDADQLPAAAALAKVLGGAEQG